jgi:amino acid efflux transporter
MGSANSRRLGSVKGTALLTGAVLGPGVLALPRLAAQAAGPASVIAWAVLIGLSVPVALTFATLGGRFSDGGGVSAFTRLAFGRSLAAAVGWWFFLAILTGAPAAAVIGGDYVAAAFGLGRPGVAAVACVLLAAAYAANRIGLHASGRLQVLLMTLLAVLLTMAILVAAPHVRAGNFVPFAPNGLTGVASAVGVLFFAFAGWEAVSQLSAEFARPRRDLQRATVLTLIIVGVLYLGLAIASAGVLGGRAATSPVPLTLLLAHGIGASARPVTAVAAVFLSFGPINTYIASGARLGAALARDGVLPRFLAAGGGVGEVPSRALYALAAVTIPVTAATGLGAADLGWLMRATSACLAAVTVVGVAAAIRLLPRRSAARRTATAATALTSAVLITCGPFLLIPAAAGLTAALAARRRTPNKDLHAERDVVHASAPR